MDYKEYLKSEEWKTLRKKKHNKSKGRCAICKNSKNLNIHHLFYRQDLSKTELSDLRLLCKRCHKLVHELEKNGKIIYKNKNHNSRFGIIKSAVKKELGLAGINCFNKKIIISKKDREIEQEKLREELKDDAKFQKRKLEFYNKRFRKLFFNTIN